MNVRAKTVVRHSRRGKIFTVAREHYLRDDLTCGSALCRLCPSSVDLGAARGRLGSRSNVYIIPDAEAMLKNVDVLLSDEAPFAEILVLESTLQHVKARSAKVYQKWSAALLDRERNGNIALFCNDHHRETYLERQPSLSDEQYLQHCVQHSAAWLTAHWQPLAQRVLLLTQKAAPSSGEVEPYIASYPALSELLVVGSDGDDENGATRGAALFPSYISSEEARRRVHAGKLYQGTFTANPMNLFEGFVSVNLDSSDKNKTGRTNVLIENRRNINRAIDRDVVVIELLPREQWRTPSQLAVREGEEADGDEPQEDDEADAAALTHASKRLRASEKGSDNAAMVTGRVVAIHKRNWKPYGGTLDAARYRGGESALFVPADRNVPKIYVRSRRIDELLKKRLQVVIDSWDRYSAHPNGHVVREIGEVGDVETETQLLLMENDIPTRKFSVTAMDCLPSDDWQVTEDNVQNRWDLRSKTVVSVDPPGCTDIDDALHAERLEDGSFEVGVHIADVTAFLRHGSALDAEAAERGTTVYLVDRRIEMLPSLLTSNLCSLQGGVERLAFSVIFRLDAEARQLDVNFGRSVIKSAAAMTYQEAQERLDDYRRTNKASSKLNESIAQSLCHLAALAAKLRERRTEDGALSLASPEVRFKFQEESHEVQEVSTYEIRETNRMVEEFMLLSNVAVAKKILQSFPQCAMLRRHPKPPLEQFEPLLKLAKAFGVELDVSSSKALNKSLDAAERRFSRKDRYIGTLLRILTTRCMTQAVYYSSGQVSRPEFLHYGLAADVYTHFTSPIRRYADVVVHRQLSATLGYSTLPDALQKSHHVEQLAEVVNYRNRCAQYAARASIHVHTMLMLKGQSGAEHEARIVRLLKNALVVLVPKFGLEGVAYVTDKGEDGAELNETTQQLICRDGRVFKIMDSVRVRVRVDSKLTRDRVAFELVDAAPEAKEQP